MVSDLCRQLQQGLLKLLLLFTAPHEVLRLPADNFQQLMYVLLCDTLPPSSLPTTRGVTAVTVSVRSEFTTE